MAQQPIAVIKDIPLVGHNQDGQHQVHDIKLGEVAAKTVVTVITSTDSEGLMRQLIEGYKWLAAF